MPGGNSVWDNNNVLEFLQHFLTCGPLRGRLVRLSVRWLGTDCSLTTRIHILALPPVGWVSLGICSLQVSISARRR